MLKTIIDRFKLEEIKLEDSLDAVKEYAELIKIVGDGEAACMALAKTNKDYIASSNLSDIYEYCKKNNIVIKTTFEILYNAIIGGILTCEECDNFIKIVRQKGNKLPDMSMNDYAEKRKKDYK